MTYQMDTDWKTMKITIRYPMPELMGTSAIPWAMPTEKGLVMAAAKPVATPT